MTVLVGVERGAFSLGLLGMSEPSPSNLRLRPQLQPTPQLPPLPPQLLHPCPIARPSGRPRKPLPIRRQHRRIPAGIGRRNLVIVGQGQPPGCHLLHQFRGMLQIRLAPPVPIGAEIGVSRHSDPARP